MTAQGWSVAADWVVAATAVLGAGFLLIDRFRPRSNVWAWANSSKSGAPGLTKISIYAANQGPEPMLLHQIEAMGDLTFDLQPSQLTLGLIKAAEQQDGTAKALKLDMRKTVKFTRQPRLLRSLGDGVEPKPLVQLLGGHPHGEQAPWKLRLTFRHVRDPSKSVVRDVEVALPVVA